MVTYKHTKQQDKECLNFKMKSFRSSLVNTNQTMPREYCKISIDRGKKFYEIDSLHKIKDKISNRKVWDKIIDAMDADTMINCFNNQSADIQSVEGKIEFLTRYLQKCKEDLIIGG